MADPQSNRSENSLWNFATRVLIAVAITGAVFLLWHVRHALLTAFAAILLAVLLLSLADHVRRLASVPHGWALTISTVLIVVLAGGFATLVGTQVQAQFGELWRALPEASRSVEQRLGIQLPGVAAPGDAGAPRGGGAVQSPPGAAAVEQILGTADAGSARGEQAASGAQSAVLSRAIDWLGSYGLTIVDAMLGVILVVVAGVYLAIDPSRYRRGTVKLFPPSQHALVDDTMMEIGKTLRWWLLGKLISMVIIGTLAGFGSWLLGLPAPLALGIFAGLTEFVPIIGPIIGAVPALLLAATEGAGTFLWTLLLFLGIQQIESNIVAPLVQERMVTIPAALLVLGIALFGGLFGLLGLVLAGPLLVVSYVAVKRLWVRQALRESTPMPTDTSRQ